MESQGSETPHHIQPANVDEKHKLLQMAEISLSLDTYDDIFSDFDPRPYSERSLSDDFLTESKKAAREKTSGTIDLKFLMPSAGRDQHLEETIKHRLHEHFRKNHQNLENETKSIKSQSALMVVVGMIFMVIVTYLKTLNHLGFLIQLLSVVLEPSGWFITWYGLDKFFYSAGHLKPDLEFYRKMSHCEIHFITY